MKSMVLEALVEESTLQKIQSDMISDMSCMSFLW